MPSVPLRVSIQGLRSDLVALLDGVATPAQVKVIVRVCHANAEGLLARRGQLGHLMRLHGLNLSDLAYDCISDLFGRGENGRYKALESYFSAYNLGAFSDEEAYFHLQRLSFTKVRNGLFRLYSEMDPQLARILHNIKIASRTLGLFIEVDRMGDSCLVPPLSDASEHLPPVEAADLTAWLMEGASGSEFIPELLGKVCLRLREQESFSRIVPVVTVGLAIRDFYKQKELPRLGEPATVIDESRIDAREAIAKACDAVRVRALAKYVQRGKVSVEAFDTYFVVIEQMLFMRFIEQDGHDFQLSESFLRLMPGTTPSEYRKHHRNKLEYLARLAHKKVSRELQR